MYAVDISILKIGLVFEKLFTHNWCLGFGFRLIFMINHHLCRFYTNHLMHHRCIFQHFLALIETRLFFSIWGIQREETFLTVKYSCDILLMIVIVMAKNAPILWYVTWQSCYNSSRTAPMFCGATTLRYLSLFWLSSFSKTHTIDYDYNVNKSFWRPNVHGKSYWS